MSKLTGITVCLLGTAALFCSIQAGNLEPPGSPGSTMVTLQEIYDRVATGPVGIAKTGLTDCWDAIGDPIACDGTGQDGEYHAGVSVDPRFTDNADGTVTDNLTGLVWLKDADCFGLRSWTDALADAQTLAGDSDSCTPDLTDGSLAGDWRLPNLRELQSLIDYGQLPPGALPVGHPFSGDLNINCWTSTTYVGNTLYSWYIYMASGDVSTHLKTSNRGVWPVRSAK